MFCTLRIRLIPYLGIATLAFVSLACGAAATQSPTAGDDGGEGGSPAAVSTLQETQLATIRVVSTGSFVQPEGEQLNVSGSGSGFIIDESGIAVTNNHVVTGAAILQVWIGEDREPRNAVVLGVSECSDLAVIDIDGDGFSYFDWVEEEISTGLDVFAAGFPLGDPEFTLTRGVVSKVRANGESTWASVGSVIEHDARINPGNSGGPLITSEGRVVGVNFAADTRGSSPQFNAIARDEALKVIDELKSGRDVNSIGVNGIAFITSDGEFSGIWVSSVESGSPADAVGIQGGDIITKLQGLVLATDGTMADYCDILRTNRPGDVLSIEVLRLGTREILAGKVNGEQLKSLATPPSPTAEPAPMSDRSAGSPSVYTYSNVQDQTGSLLIEIPDQWRDVDKSQARYSDSGETYGAALRASTDLDGYIGEWDTPGVYFIASKILAQTMTEADLLEVFSQSESCTLDSHRDYSDPLYTGLIDVYGNCPGGAVVINIAAMPEDRSFIAFVQVQLLTETDVEAYDRIQKSFNVFVDRLPR